MSHLAEASGAGPNTSHPRTVPARRARSRRSGLPSSLVVSGNKNKTFKPTKSHPDANINRGKLSEYAKATLGSGNMRSAVVLPKGEELNEWLAGQNNQGDIESNLVR